MRNWLRLLISLVVVLTVGLISVVGYNILKKGSALPGPRAQNQQWIAKGENTPKANPATNPPTKNTNPPGFNPKGVSMLGGHRDNLGLGANGTPTNKFQPQTQLLMDRSKAVNIRTQLQTISGLTQVNVIVGGSNVVIGYKAAAGADINKINGEIAQKVKQMEPLARKIAISQNDSVIASINKLSKDVYSNRKAEDVLADIASLAASIGVGM